jgi:hypothetical protein
MIRIGKGRGQKRKAGAGVPRGVGCKAVSKGFDFTNGKTLRDWLSDKTFKEQYEYGKKLLDREMKQYEKDPKKY